MSTRLGFRIHTITRSRFVLTMVVVADWSSPAGTVGDLLRERGSAESRHEEKASAQMMGSLMTRLYLARPMP